MERVCPYGELCGTRAFSKLCLAHHRVDADGAETTPAKGPEERRSSKRQPTVWPGTEWARCLEELDRVLIISTAPGSLSHSHSLLKVSPDCTCCVEWLRCGFCRVRVYRKFHVFGRRFSSPSTLGFGKPPVLKIARHRTEIHRPISLSTKPLSSHRG